MYNIYQSLKETATNLPDQVAMIDELGEITYSELFLETEKLRSELEVMGLKKGVGVGLLTDNNRFFVIGLYAIAGTGALVMPIFHQQKPNEIKKSVEDAGLHVVLGNIEKHVELFGNARKVDNSEVYMFCSTGKPMDKPIADFIENPAFMRFTSGTTGKAKGVVISHESVLDRINLANTALKINSNDKILWVFPMAYHFVVSIVLYIKNGATIVVNNDFLAESIWSSLNQYEITFFYCSPMHIKLMAAFEAGSPIQSLRTVISTTTAASKQSCIDFQHKYKIPVQQAFGIIEVGLPIINTNMAETHPDAVGHIIEGYEAEVLSDNGAPVTKGEVGLLGLKGPGMFSGYLTPPKKLEEVLVNGWFLTGDLAEINNEGLITIRGRKKDVIIIHGNKVFPIEVEEVINTYPGIKQSKVYGKPHSLFGEVVVADIVVDTAIDTEEVISYCRDKLSSFKVPQFLTVVESIETTGSGKIKRG